MSDRTTRFVGLYAVIAAATAVVVAPLLGLSYFAIPSGAEEETGTVAIWADPARELAGGLLTFASAGRVYATYVQILGLILPALLLCAWVTRSRRRADEMRLERWGWRLAIAGYAMLAAGIAIVSVMLIGVSASSSILDLAYLPLVFPGIVLGTIGSSVLGIALLRAAYAPRVTAWLLALVFPLWIVGDFVVGHNGLGLVPLFVAWATTGVSYARRGRRSSKRCSVPPARRRRLWRWRKTIAAAPATANAITGQSAPRSGTRTTSATAVTIDATDA